MGRIEVDEDRIIFSGSAKYEPLVIKNIAEIKYVPSNDKLQEISVVSKDNGAMTYHLHNSNEYFSSTIEKINKLLKEEADNPAT